MSITVDSDAYGSEHCCTSNPLPGEIRIRYCRAIEGQIQQRWHMQMTTLANQQAVLDGEADCVGDVLSSYTLMISYCPFCGLELHGLSTES